MIDPFIVLLNYSAGLEELVWVEDNPEGGSYFYLWLLKEEEVISMVKIMLVDDEPDFRFILKIALNEEGYEIVEIQSGNECLLKIEEIKPDLVILDIMMPDTDGWEVCKKIKETIKDIPVSMLTVRGSEDSIKKSLEYAHADRHLTKPIKIKEVRNTIKELLEAY